MEQPYGCSISQAEKNISPELDEISGAVSSFPANGASPFKNRPSTDNVKTK
jgi:hypothetical protein